MLYRCYAGTAPTISSGVLSKSTSHACLLRNRIELIHREQNGWRANANASDPLVEYLNMLPAPVNLRDSTVRNQAKIGIIASHHQAVGLVRKCIIEQ